MGKFFDGKVNKLFEIICIGIYIKKKLCWVIIVVLFVCFEWLFVLLLFVFIGNIFFNNRIFELKNNVWFGFNVIIVNVFLIWVIGS